MTEKLEVLVSVEEVSTMFDEQGHPRYDLQKVNEIVSPVVLAQLLGIKPQMVYNYISKEMIKGVKDNSTQKIVIELEEALRWSAKYLNKKEWKKAKEYAELVG